MRHHSAETRRRVVNLVLDGATQEAAARLAGVRQGTVSAWLRRYRRGGWEALENRPHYKALPSWVRCAACGLYRQNPNRTLYDIARAISAVRWPRGEHRMGGNAVRQILEEEGLIDPFVELDRTPYRDRHENTATQRAGT